MHAAAGLGVLLLFAVFAGLPLDHPAITFRLWADYFDLGVYYKSSRWVTDGGTLYRDVFSEYPLLANLVFAAVRGVSTLVSGVMSERAAFYWAWISTACCLYLGTLYTVVTRIGTRAVWLWLAPAPLYFGLYRFDLVPAVLTLYALLALRDGRDVRAMMWMGLALATKGYALFFLPSLFVYFHHRHGFVRAVLLAALAAAPWMLGHLLTYAFAGFDGVAMPYRYHAERPVTVESSLGALAYLIGWPGLTTAPVTPHLATLLLVLSSLIPAALRPQTFTQLVHALLFTTAGFMSASVFYSPQFVLWVLPMASLSASPWVRGLALAFAWTSYLHFPLLYRTALAQPMFVVGAALRLALALTALPLMRARVPGSERNTATGTLATA